MQILAKVFLCVSIYGVGVTMVQGSSLNKEVLPHSAVVASDGSVTLRDQKEPARSADTAVVASDGSVTRAVNREVTLATDNIEAIRWSNLQKLVANTKKKLQQSLDTVRKNTKKKIQQKKQKWQPIVEKAGTALENELEAAKKWVQKYGNQALKQAYAAAERAAQGCQQGVEDEIRKINATAQAELWPKIEVAKIGAELTVAEIEQQIEALLTALEEENLVAAAEAFVAVNETVHEIEEELKVAWKAFEAHAPYLVDAAEDSVANVNATCMTSVTNELEQLKQGLAGLALKALTEAEAAAKEFYKEVNAFKEDALKIIQAEYEQLLKDLEEASTEATAEYSELEAEQR